MQVEMFIMMNVSRWDLRELSKFLLKEKLLRRIDLKIRVLMNFRRGLTSWKQMCFIEFIFYFSWGHYRTKSLKHQKIFYNYKKNK